MVNGSKNVKAFPTLFVLTLPPPHVGPPWLYFEGHLGTVFGFVRSSSACVRPYRLCVGLSGAFSPQKEVFIVNSFFCTFPTPISVPKVCKPVNGKRISKGEQRNKGFAFVVCGLNRWVSSLSSYVDANQQERSSTWLDIIALLYRNRPNITPKTQHW